MTRSRKRPAARAGFFILNGVRRALASREVGRKTVPAIILRDGQPPERRSRVRLTSLFSPKATVEYDARFIKIEPPIEEPIMVQPLGARAQPRFVVPLMSVRLV